MASIDLESSYKSAKNKIQATKAYTDLKSQYDSVKKQAGDSFEQGKDSISGSVDKLEEQLDAVKEQSKRYQREIKNQFEQLLDINNVTGGKGSNTIRYVKKMLIKTIKNIEPKISDIIVEESLKAVGCSQQQTYNATTLYVKVSSVDIGGLLKRDPFIKQNKVLYEKDLPVIQSSPFSMNRELYNRVSQPNISYTNANGQDYFGRSGQALFDITFVETNNFGETGPWFKVDLRNRPNSNNVNVVGEFLVDYFKTIKLFEFTNVMSNIMNSLSGAVSFKAQIGLNEVEDATKFERYVARILGLCFDNRNQIDVSGVAKVAELDGLDESFFEFNQVELRNIENKVNNILNGVVEYNDCSTEKLPVNADSIIDALDKLNFVEGRQLDDAAENLSDVLSQNPEWAGLALTGNIKAAVDLNFVKLIVSGLIFSLLGPKVLLPILVMIIAISSATGAQINGYQDFVKKFKEFFKEIVSKIGGIFIKELFNLIKADIKNLIQQVIMDLAKEQANKKVIMILKLVQLLLVVAQFISDWRKCKSVIDEILYLLKIAFSGWGSQVPLPLLFASQLLDGASSTRAFIGTIEELQSLGIPTGPMPDGSPNLQVLSILSQLKAQAAEDAENGKVQIAIPPLTITPAGITLPQSAFGKKF